jgi:hypothetical protein
MSYDHRFPQATLKKTKAGIERLSEWGCPQEKIALGVPFYGKNKAGHARSYASLAAGKMPDPKAGERGWGKAGERTGKRREGGEGGERTRGERTGNAFQEREGKGQAMAGERRLGKGQAMRSGNAFRQCVPS